MPLVILYFLQIPLNCIIMYIALCTCEPTPSICCYLTLYPSPNFPFSRGQAVSPQFFLFLSPHDLLRRGQCWNYYVVPSYSSLLLP